MNNDLNLNTTPQPDESWETTVRDLAREFTYPSTPDIARRTSQRLIKPRRPVVGVLKVAVVVLLALTVVIASVPVKTRINRGGDLSLPSHGHEHFDALVD